MVPRLRREQLYELILDRADAIGVGCVEVEVIDRINILQATKLAMRQAVERLSTPADHLLIDALRLPVVDLPQRPSSTVTRSAPPSPPPASSPR